MRILLSILILFFSLQTTIKADDIRDFQIEGISIGDSALKFFSENEIKKNKRNPGYKKGNNAEFTHVENEKKSFFKTYDYVDFNFKTGDKKYIIHSIKGGIDYSEKPISDCKKKIKEIFNELSLMFTNMQVVKIKATKSKISPDRINTWGTFFSKDGQITVGCHEFTKGSRPNYLAVSIRTREFNNFLATAYK